MSSLKEKERAANCVTHHHACDCREYKQQARIEELEANWRNYANELEANWRNYANELEAENQRLREALRDNWCYEKTELDKILEDD